MEFELGGQVTFEETSDGIIMHPVRRLSVEKRTSRLTFSKRNNTMPQGHEA
jgi:hypothetical protein